jgi:hypothetical protein
MQEVFYKFNEVILNKNFGNALTHPLKMLRNEIKLCPYVSFGYMMGILVV